MGVGAGVVFAPDRAGSVGAGVGAPGTVAVAAVDGGLPGESRIGTFDSPAEQQSEFGREVDAEAIVDEDDQFLSLDSGANVSKAIPSMPTTSV